MAGSDGADITELSATQLGRAIVERRCSVAEATTGYLGRIATLDRNGPALNAVIEVNPAALDIARALDDRLHHGGPIGPLHGVPVLLKANVDTADAMATSAGSRALAAHHATVDAPLVAHLRRAGVVLLGKTNLTEWANFRSTAAIDGWSSLGGQTKNPYQLDRSPSGSSSGSAVAVAARLAPLAVGTETDGSIISPASANGVVGIKPRRGLVSSQGIIPIAASLDTAGPFATTVRDAAALLDAMAAPRQPSLHDALATHLAPLRGLWIGALREHTAVELHTRVSREFDSMLGVLAALGADIVDPVCLGVDQVVRQAERQLLLHEFKDGFNRYLGNHSTAIADLAELIAYNERQAATVMPTFGQDLLEAAEATQGLHSAEYAEALAASVTTIGRRLAEIFATRRLDALIAPVNAPAPKIGKPDGPRLGAASIAALGGYPSIAVPSALVDGLPVGLVLIGVPGAEHALLSMAAAFEDARGPFPKPRYE